MQKTLFATSTTISLKISWLVTYIQINTWAFPYWPGYNPLILILARDGVEGQYGSRDVNQVNMEMPMH